MAGTIITVTSEWVRWYLKSPASWSFTQSFVQAQIKENIKTPRHWPLWGEFTGDRWIRLTKGQWRGKCFHLMTSSLPGGLAIGVPGEVAGYWKAWQMFGKLPWRDLYEPTIKMLREGYPVPSAMAKAIKSIAWRIEEDENLRYHYSDGMCAMASQITGIPIVCPTICSAARSKKTTKLRVTGLCAGNPLVTDGFPQ